MEGTNSFEKGLHKSNSPQMQPEGSYVDAINWIRNDSGRLINEDLENVVHTFSEETVLLGHCPIKNEFICFLKTYNSSSGIWNSIIGTFSEGIYTEIFNDKNHNYFLNFTNEIDCVSRIVSSGSRVVYFVEDGNPIRRFDLDQYLAKPNLYDTYEDFNLQLTVKYPKLSTLINTRGTLTASSYSFITRYVDGSNNKTQWGIPSRMISIVPGNGTSESNEGAAPDTTTDKNIQITLQDCDLNYPFVEIAVIKYEGIINAKIIKTLGVFRNDTKIVVDYTSDSQLGDNIDLTSVNDAPVYYDSAKCIEQKDNILLISNLTTKKYDSDFQDIANKIVVTTYVEQLPLDNKRGINVRGYYIGADTTNEKIGFGSVDQYNEVDQWFGRDNSGQTITDVYNNTTNLYKNSSLKKGFQPDEIYSFSITPIYKDGSIGFAYHIPCNKDTFSTYLTVDSVTYSTTKKYTSSLEYPLDMNMGPIGTKIRHHIMPSLLPTSDAGDKINILRVKFFNILISPEIQSKIQGYIIGFQQRNKDINTSIVDEGIAVPYNFWREDNKFYNGVLNGRVNFTGDNNSFDPTEEEEDNDVSINEQSSYIASGSPYAMFYSPSTEVGLQIKEGYKFQIHRNAYQYYYNTIAATAGQPYTRPSILRHISYYGRNSTYDALFFDGNKHAFTNLSPRAIVNTTRANGDYDSNQYNIIDGKFVIGGGTNFTHIETTANQQLWDTFSPDISIVGWRIRTPDNADRMKKVVSIKLIETQKTSVARITNNIPNQYGNIYDAEYLVAETILDLSQDKVEVEGDTYTFKHWFNIRSIHKQKIAGSDKQFNFDFLAGVWLTSQNNFALRHRESEDAAYYPETKNIFLSEDNADMFGEFWWKRTLGYNKQYSAINNNKLNFPKPLLFSENNVFTNRTIYSKQAFESELSDQYRVFPYVQFHDVPKDRGAITDTFVFNNNFFIHTEYGLWQAYFNPNTTQATSQGQIVLGNAGIFTIPSKLVLDIKGGYMGTLDKSGINTPFGRIFIDHSQKKLFLFDGSAPVEISDLGLFSFFRENVDKNRKYAFGYDWKNKRILLSTIKPFSNDLSAVVNNGQLETLSIYTDYSSFSKAKDLGELEVPIKIKTWETIFFKISLNETKYIIMDIRIQGPCIMNVYKKLFSGDIELVKSTSLPTSNYTDTVFNPGTIYEYVVKTYEFTRYIEELDKGEHYIEIVQEDLTQSGVFNREINLVSRLKEYPSQFAISYYPKTQTWTSLHDFAPSSYLTINSSSYAWYNNSFYNLSNQDGVKKNSYITFVENTQPDAFKRFDRMEINTMSGGEEVFGSNYQLSPGSVLEDSYKFLDKSFTHIHCWTDRQNSTELPLFYSHDYNLMSEYYNDRIPANYYRSAFHIELPQDAVIDPYINIFEPNNLDIDADFKSHLKGKFLYTKLSYKDDKPLVLNYVKTFFKPSVA